MGVKRGVGVLVDINLVEFRRHGPNDELPVRRNSNDFQQRVRRSVASLRQCHQLKFRVFGIVRPIPRRRRRCFCFPRDRPPVYLGNDEYGGRPKPPPPLRRMEKLALANPVGSVASNIC